MAETLSPKPPEPPRGERYLICLYIYLYIGVSANAPGCNDPIAALEQGLSTRQST